jgi:Domain of unknown function (DUF4062)
LQKKYQIFVSSTYTDLIVERQAVLRSILDLGHIPSGMEIFSAADNEQFDYIKKVIDECDYYVLIIGGRYGSVDESGISYTEKEYDYAFEKGIPVLAFIHDDIKKIAFGRVDAAPDKAQKLQAFTDKVSKRRLVSLWSERETLQAKVIVSLTKAFADAPGVGWVRADTAASEDILGEIIKLRRQADVLIAENDALKEQLVPQVSNIAPLSDSYLIHFKHKSTNRNANGIYDSSISISWKDIVKIVGPMFFKPASASNITTRIIGALYERYPTGYDFTLYASLESTIKIQLVAYGFLKIFEAQAVDGGVAEFLQLTDLGRRMLIEITAVRAAPSHSDNP